MNYLAHLALAPRTPQLLAGNLLGDFVKGRESLLRARYPQELVDGMMMHRAVDRATDMHPAFRHSRSLLTESRRRFAGIVVDIIYDHFLTLHWQEFFEQSLEDFVESVYGLFDTHPEWVVGELASVYPRMKREQWLLKYRSEKDLNHIFKQLSKRCRFKNTMGGTIKDLRANYEGFSEDFCEIFSDLQKVIKTLTHKQLWREREKSNLDGFTPT